MRFVACRVGWIRGRGGRDSAVQSKAIHPPRQRLPGFSICSTHSERAWGLEGDEGGEGRRSVRLPKTNDTTLVSPSKFGFGWDGQTTAHSSGGTHRQGWSLFSSVLPPNQGGSRDGQTLLGISYTILHIFALSIPFLPPLAGPLTLDSWQSPPTETLNRGSPHGTTHPSGHTEYLRKVQEPSPSPNPESTYSPPTTTREISRLDSTQRT